MKFSETPEDVVNEIYIASDKYEEYGDLRIRQLIHVLGKVADNIIVEALIQVFERNERLESIFLDQEIAGQILEARKPFTNTLPDKLIIRCLAGWNKSIEQFPFWLAENFGVKNILTALSAIENKGLSEIEKRNLAAMRWWIHGIR